MVLDGEKLDILMEELESCATVAYEMQADIARGYKDDGSVLTKADTTISRRVMVMLSRLFPTCNRISEEERSAYKEDAPYTFILDPIDGTDVYSQGLPCFAIALGILDSCRQPVGAMVIAPRFGIAQERFSIRLDPGQKPILDSKPLRYPQGKDMPTQITLSSKSQKLVDFSHFHGKVRTFGSSIIHILAPAIYPYIQGCINQPAYAWDIAAAHAVLRAVGMDIEYADGTPFVYDRSMLEDRMPCHGTIYCGTETCRHNLRELLPLRS
ncbi:MAG: inositol monophosphatase [Spirochaetia bacterium]|jgi:myo-inositol-1(or 4)-monophosphatase|nr:inositol monophosphatase [Spirochaetia bacterium]